METLVRASGLVVQSKQYKQYVECEVLVRTAHQVLNRYGRVRAWKRLPNFMKILNEPRLLLELVRIGNLRDPMIYVIDHALSSNSLNSVY